MKKTGYDTRNFILRMTQKAICISLILFLYSYSIKSQESLGFSLDKYSGTTLIDLNPALSSSSVNRWDVTLGAFHGFGFTDYGLLRRSSLFNLNSNLNNAFVVEAQPDIPANDGTTEPLIIFDEDGGDKKLSTHIEVTGPSFLFNLAPTIKLGIFTKARGNLSAPNIPEALGFYELNNARFSAQELALTSTKVSAMYWQEIGIHGSKRIGPLSFGINMKYLLGAEGFYIRNDVTTTYPFTVDNLNIEGLPVDLEFGLTNGTLDSETFSPFSNIDDGVGLGWDFGVTYEDDRLKIGASILDFGRISFTQNIETYRLTDQNTNVDISIYETLGSVRQFLAQIVQDFEVETSRSDAFKIGLPTALSLQGDLHLLDNYYVSATLTQRVPVFPNSLRRDNSLSVIPRYESKWLSAFLPITVYEYSRIRVGAAARFGFLTIGSDHIFSTFTNSDFRGSDIYVKLAFFPFRERTFSDKKSKKGKGKGLDCYTF